jgi:type VI secretion system protein ImpK
MSMLSHLSDEEYRIRDAKDAGVDASCPENLALLYQGLLTGIVRVKSRRQHITDGESFRRRTKATLQEVERFAAAAGYEARDVRDAHFAVVAFLDSVVLNSGEAVRAEWERKTLQEEVFGQTDAGVVFFEKLEHFYGRRDSAQLADILEVYLLCLLLGFEGRYSGALRAELDNIVEKVKRRIDDIRGSDSRLSPSCQLPDEPALPRPPSGKSKYFHFAALTALLFTLILFLLLLWSLSALTGEVRARLV